MKQIPLTRGKVALVDDEDFERLSQWSWCCVFTKSKNTTKFYALRGTRAGGVNRSVFMHREILRVNCRVDHKDGDGLNNQKYNLRPCSQSQNQMNRIPIPGKYKGVHFHKCRDNWIAYIHTGGKKLHLGSFDCSESAAMAYNNAATKYYGEFARLNQILE